MHNYDEILQFLNDRAIYYIDCNGEQQPLDADILNSLKEVVRSERNRCMGYALEMSLMEGESDERKNQR